MSAAQRLPFGSWPSPLSAAHVAVGGVRLSGLTQRGNEIWWSELRPSEAGRCVLVRRTGGDDAHDLLGPPWSARSLVHEYGGGAWWLGAQAAYFAHWDDQRLYRFDPDAGTEPVPVTPEPPQPRAWRYADGREHPHGSWIACVRERHDGGPEPVNELVAIDLARISDGVLPEPVVLASSADLVAEGRPVADFVAAPRFSADGSWMSWVRWSHPNMPWDGTELCAAPVEGMQLGPIEVIAGGGIESLHGGDWTADGRLLFSSDLGGYWNLHSWPPGSDSYDRITFYEGAEIGAPAWNFGTQRWAELPDGRVVAAVTKAAVDQLVVIEANGSITPLDTPFVAIIDLGTTDQGTILVHGATTTSLAALVELDPEGQEVAIHRAPDDLGVDDSWLSVARPVTYRTGEHEVHAFVYEPTAPDIEPEPGERPPLVVMGHGGPTAHSGPALNLRVQYWTSRGFAVADVNYRGSSGFGRSYRRQLYGQWGVADVEDCITVASQLADDGVVDGDRLAIRGGSAGGFTVLSALAQSDVFAAGTSLYGVADLEALARDTHKFESRYLDRLVGPYPAERAIYEQRSPINHTDELSCPLLVLQGLEDEIVPPNQSEAIVAALAAKGIPHAYVAFEGEQHGFRQATNIIRSYEVELWFYGRVFGFTPADEIDPPAGAVGL